MEPKRPQLSLDELHQLKWLLGGVLVLLSVWTVFYLDLEAWTLMGLATVGVGAVLARPDWPARIPTWGHRLVFPAVVAFFAGDLWVTREVLPAIVRLDLLLLLYRGTTYRKKRDDLQVIVLGLFLIVVAGVLTVSLAFAAQILVFTACALAFLLVVTLVESAEQGAATESGPGAPRWTAVKWGHLLGRVRAVTDWRVVALGAGLFVGVVGVSAALFLVIPRFQLENSLFLERFVTKKTRSGFNETIRFGEVTEIQQDNSVAASVDVTDRGQIPATPYWRMLVLDEYREGSFRLSAELRRGGFTRERMAANVRGTRRPQLGAPVYWTFYLESGVSRYLPLLGAFEQLRFQEIQNFRLGADLAVVALRDEPATMTAYRVEGMNPSDLLPDANFAKRLGEAVNPRVDPLVMLKPGVGPADQEALRRLVREAAGDGALAPAEFARRVNTWLGRHHAYSLSPKIPAGPGDALVRWIDSNEGGHCELFAGAFVLLARTAGYPARVVTGFKGGSWNAYSDNFTLRNSDAHAWCEIFDAAAGAWRRTDPTLGAASAQENETKGEAALARRTDRSWSARLDSLRVFWYRRIVNFDQRSQVETLKAIKSATENSGRRLREMMMNFIHGFSVDGLKAWLAEPWNGPRIGKVVASVLAMFAAGWGLRELGKGWRRRSRTSGWGLKIDPVREEAGAWLRRLKDLRFQIEDEAGLGAELQRLRFGARATWPEPTAVFRRARRAVRSARTRSPATRP